LKVTTPVAGEQGNREQSAIGSWQNADPPQRTVNWLLINRRGAKGAKYGNKLAVGNRQ